MRMDRQCKRINMIRRGHAEERKGGLAATKASQPPRDVVQLLGVVSPSVQAHGEGGYHEAH